MILRLIATAFFLFFSVTFAVHAAQPTSPYAGQEGRDIKALSSEETAALLGGKGMGLAKAAELNGFPGPAHVLELAVPLGLTAEQRSQTEALFASMESRAKSLGHALVEEERKLDALFASRSVTVESLNHSLAEIATLQAKVRAAHLEAHLAQVEVLTPEQTALYARLRGYTGTGTAPHGAHKH